MKRFKLSTEVLFSEDAIDALLEIKDVNAVLFPCLARLFLTRQWI